MSAPRTQGPADRVRQRAREIGFDRVGFARAGESRDADRFRAWLAGGREAELAYMRTTPERRTDPRNVLPGCRTVVVATVGHWYPDGPVRAALPARVARYARGRDYHRTLEGMLKRLTHALEDECDGHSGATRHRWYVDHGPVLERAWAAEAGIGFVGKNAMLIDPRRGSWSTLGVVLTTLALPADDAVTDSCGTCTKCLPACPTGAIVGPGQVDARLCISYWTIEHRGALPEWARAAIGTRVFGCDDCQDVCPWNRFAEPATVDDHRPRALFVDPDLSALAALTWEQWDEATRGTAVRRVGYEGLLRNVACALGNTADERARAPLDTLMHHDSELVRDHARWALAQLDA